MKKNVTAASNKKEGSAAGVLTSHRDSILKAALTILSKGGRDALTTRSVAEAAHVQPPILYRLFHDKAGLLNAVADYGFDTYMAKKRSSEVERDPVASLRVGWRIHVEFGLSHPELYLLMYADPQPEVVGKAAERSRRLLQDHMRRVGRCRTVKGQRRACRSSLPLDRLRHSSDAPWHESRAPRYVPIKCGL